MFHGTFASSATTPSRSSGTSLGFVSVIAHDACDGLVANVPFGFFLGDAHLPAGRYAFEGGLVLFIRDADRQVRGRVKRSPWPAAVAGGRLIFERVGERLLLTAVWAPPPLH
ncbi:MAG: hypothetical protein U0166_13910 [Acidobacteriota bacterium]